MLAIAAVPASAAAPVAAPLPQLELLSTATIPMPDGVPSAHASTLVTLGGGELLAIWWAGSRESAADVAIYASRWIDGGANSVERPSAAAGAGGSASADRGAPGAWSAARRIVERHELATQLGFGVRRLGNPVAWVARDGRLHLYAVATGPGGWAAARIAHLVSIDRGQTFKAQRVLPLSPLFALHRDGRNVMTGHLSRILSRSPKTTEQQHACCREVLWFGPHEPARCAPIADDQGGITTPNGHSGRGPSRPVEPANC